MNPLEVKDIVAPVATLTAAILAASFGRWTSQVRLARLKTAIEVRDKLNEDLQISWDIMIETDAEAVLRQSARAPAPMWIVLWLSGVTLALGSWTSHSWVLLGGASALVISCGVLGVWGLRRVRSLLRTKRRMISKVERDALASLQATKPPPAKRNPKNKMATSARKSNRRTR